MTLRSGPAWDEGKFWAAVSHEAWGRSMSDCIESPAESPGTAEHFRWLAGIVKAVLVLNLVDALMTLWWVRSGLATEANVLLSEFVERHAVVFVVAKLALVSLGTAILWLRRSRPLAVVGIFAAFLVYYGVVLYHLQFASLIVRELLPS